MRRKGVALLLIACLSGAVAAPARGGLVTWEFGGEIQRVLDSNDLLEGALPAGSSFFGSFTFDPSTPGTVDGGGRMSFQDPLFDLSGQLGTFAFSGPLLSTSSLDIINGAPGSNDIFNLSSSVLFNGQALNFLLTLSDSTGTAFASDTLLSVPPDLGLFDSTTIRLLRQTNDLTIDGSLTALTPDPGTLWLLGVGTAVVLRRRRRR